MTCSRCQSLMVHELPVQFYASHIDFSEDRLVDGYRCPCCGEYVDAVILRNRASQHCANSVNTSMEGFHHASTEMRRKADLYQDAA